MLWYFLAGFIAGAVAFERFICWADKRIRKRNQMQAFGGKKDD